MPAQARLSIGTLGRLGAAAAAAYAGNAAGVPALGVALGSVLAGYLTNRANIVEEEFEQDAGAARNHHLQLALAGAFRIALEEFGQSQPTHKPLFDAWEAILDAALEPPATLLPAILPAEYDPVLDAANPHVDQAGAFAEVESLLRFWLAYQQAFERTKSYPAVPPGVLPELPPALRESLLTGFLPLFQKAFASLLVRNDAAYARRAFARRSLEELVAASREHGRILQRLDAQFSLPLAPLRQPAPIDRTRELEILRAENRAIPMLGRESDLAGLRAWLASPAPVSCRILTGPAGAGKTRLAIQLLEELRGSGWDAGFLRDFHLADLNQRLWDRPTLAIVDYAASSAQPLKIWLAHLADQEPAHPLRVLLLEREASRESGWLRFVLDETSTGQRIASLLDPPQPERVTPVGDIQLRRQILEATLRQLGAAANLPAAGVHPEFDQRLAQPLWQDPLYLMMAALVARQPGGLPQALSLSRTDLAFRVADRELDRIRKFLPAGAPPETAQLLIHLAGIVTACRSLERPELVEVAIEESAALGLQFAGGPRVAAERVAEALGRQGKLAPIEPDVVGEAVLVRCFGAESPRTLVRAASRGEHRHAGDVCFAITRTTQDFAADDCQAPLDWVEEFIRAGEKDDVDLLLALEDQMPRNTLVLRERAARVDRLLLTRFTQVLESTPSEQVQSLCARFANNLSVRLSELGRREEALENAEEAVRIRRQLAQQRPDAFLPDLAMSLNNLANRLSGLGRREEALENAEETFRIRRQLAQQRPDAFLPALAMSLNNLANMLSDLGRREEALENAGEAVSLYRQLAQQRPDAFLPDLAMSLNNLANSLSDLGRREEALENAGEAVRLYRQLAQQWPDAFLPALAMSLNNLAAMLGDLGRREEALENAGEAVRLYRQLAQQWPDAFLPALAMSLNNLAAMLGDLGRREEALENAGEAVRLRRQLAQQRPDAFLPDLAMSLNNLANRLSELGRREEALENAGEAVRLYRHLAQQRQDAFLPDLAMSLNNLALRLSDLGRREEALENAGEAVRLRRQLAQQRPDAFLPDLAMSLNNLANRLGELGRREEALENAGEAVRLRRQLAQQRPDALLPDLATSLNNLANRLSDLGRREEALENAEEAVRLYRQLVQQRPDAFLPDLAMSLNNLALWLSDLGRREEALEQAEEAVRLYRQLAQQRPDAFLPALAMSLNNLALWLSDLGRREEALEQAEEAVRLYRQLAQQRPDAFLPALAMSLNNLANVLSDLGRREEALEQAEEAVRLYRQLAQQRPDAFLPDLARSLAVRANILANGRPGEAAEQFAEAIRLLAPFFTRFPKAHAALMQSLRGTYLQAAQSAKIEPDGRLLAEVAAVFERLDQRQAT